MSSLSIEKRVGLGLSATALFLSGCVGGLFPGQRGGSEAQNTPVPAEVADGGEGGEPPEREGGDVILSQEELGEMLVDAARQGAEEALAAPPEQAPAAEDEALPVDQVEQEQADPYEAEKPPYGVTSFVAPKNSLFERIAGGIGMLTKVRFVDYVESRFRWLREGISLRGDDFAFQLFKPVQGGLSERWPGFYDDVRYPDGRGLGFSGEDLRVLQDAAGLEGKTFSNANELLAYNSEDNFSRGWAIVPTRDVDQTLWLYIQAVLSNESIDPTSAQGVEMTRRIFNRVWYEDWDVRDLGAPLDGADDIVGPETSVCQAFMGTPARAGDRLSQPDELLRWVWHDPDLLEQGIIQSFTHRDTDELTLVAFVVPRGDVNGLRAEAYNAAKNESGVGEDDSGRASMERWYPCGEAVVEQQQVGAEEGGQPGQPPGGQPEKSDDPHPDEESRLDRGEDDDSEDLGDTGSNEH